MSQWIRPEILYALFFVITISTVVIAENGPALMSVCGPSPTTTTESASRLVFVSTLDGKLSALDLADKGKIKWTIEVGDGPMLSSNIHRRELNNDGHWVRLIPSLNGGLYKFDGDNLEPVPVSTDRLLRSSFRYSDDLVFSGGKETRSYGVSTRTGEILYRCTMDGCANRTDGESFPDHDVLLVQRFQQTVRAVEPRSGLEKWNFSVGLHDLTLMPRSNDDCTDNARKLSKDIQLRAIVPEGVVWAVNKTNPRVKLWQHKFDSPIVSLWRQDTTGDVKAEGKLAEVDLFDGTQWTWGSELSVRPGLYVGMHDRQLYVQENTQLSRMLERPVLNTDISLKFPWRPFPAIENAIAVTGNKKSKDNEDEDDDVRDVGETPSTTALSILYNSEYINGNGYYLYSREQYDGSNQCNRTNPNIILVDDTNNPPEVNYKDADDDETPVQVMIVSLWYWWKEVSLISVLTALVVNFMLPNWPRVRNVLSVVREAGQPPVIIETYHETCPIKEDDQNSLKNFESRYDSDFVPIDCLGRGGYGVVFEAKNKIDDCNYAIKRIALPNSRDSRDRVMREAKALAKLDHQNIVRYFNAWLECPPDGWIKQHDEKYITKSEHLSGSLPSRTSRTGAKPDSSVLMDVPRSDPSSLDSACDALDLNRRFRAQDSLEIVFAASEDEAVEASETRSSRSESIVFKSSDDSDNPEESRKSKVTDNDEKIKKKRPQMFLYIQMQLCQKLSLREWLMSNGEAPRDFARIVNIFQQIVDAVEYVHLKGLIHRDLKPSNIFFAYDDRVKVGDFGLVTGITEGYEDSPQVSNSHDSNKRGVPPSKNRLHTARVGTDLYMSPEQKNGQTYNYKVDIYSLGIILFELLTPFGTEMERFLALTDLRQLNVPNGFDSQHPQEFELLRLMLAQDPTKRPTTFGIKARPPFASNATDRTDETIKWHFDLPQLSRHSSVASSSTSTSISSAGSWDKLELMTAS